MILDDFDARQGSATSLLRTVIGVCLRELGGQITIAELIRLMSVVGVAASHTRTAVSRLKSKGLLVPGTVAGQSGYLLNPDAVPMLQRGDRRIFTFRQMADGDPWCLLSFSIPEAQRHSRHQLRKRLGWIGCGTVATGLWICPAFLTDEVQEIVASLDLTEYVTVFITTTPLTSGSLLEAAGRWWDLDNLATLHRAFLVGQGGTAQGGTAQGGTAQGGTAQGDTAQGDTAQGDTAQGGAATADGPRASFARFIHAVDQWRILPYLDPGLPPSALPPDWPGFDSVALFEHIRARHEPRAHEFLLDAVTR
ncbi:MAG: PaaX family transcriptional regulator C-terminal domain-containing protein [Microbacteriaceae bacterium]